MKIAGFASTPLPDARHRSIAPFAFNSSLSRCWDVTRVPFCIDHDPFRRAGEIISLEVREATASHRGGLYCTALLDVGLHSVRALADDIARKIPYGFSINATRNNVGWHNITAATLHEISITKHPMNSECMVNWCDRPQPRIWPDEYAEMFAEQDEAISRNKAEIERNQSWLTEKLKNCGMR